MLQSKYLPAFSPLHLFIMWTVYLTFSINHANAEEVGKTEKIMYDFAKNAGGWWTYKDPKASINTAHEKEGATGTDGSLKITYNYGKGNSYLGIGVDPKFIFGGKTSWEQFSGGHISLYLKNKNAGGVRMEIRGQDKKSYALNIAKLPEEWIQVLIPLSSFKNKGQSFSAADTDVSKLAIIPRKGSGKEQILWIDNITISSTPLELSKKPAVFTAKGKIKYDGKPLNGAEVVLSLLNNFEAVDKIITTTDGDYSVSCSVRPRAYLVKPETAINDESGSQRMLYAAKEGFAPVYQTLELLPGENSFDIAMNKKQNLPELKVKGNRLVDPQGKEVWLQGLSVDSLEWCATGDHTLPSTLMAIRGWKSNCIRLPMRENFWFGTTPFQKDGGKYYRELIDRTIQLAAANGCYVALDLHRFGAPMPEHVEFWKNAAEKYKNNPAVFFELFNEPHGISWEIWRNGGDLKSKKNKHNDEGAIENTEKNSGKFSPGMQALLDAVRSTGAKNIVIAGGLDWSYDLRVIINGYALEEKNGGNGIMYSTHIYPQKKGWQAKVLDIAEKHPIFVGEVGNFRAWSDFPFLGVGKNSEDLSTGEWARDMIGTIQKHRLNWTAFSFHPRCGPMVIEDFNYTPTKYWGIYVKPALAGKIYTANRLR